MGGKRGRGRGRSDEQDRPPQGFPGYGMQAPPHGLPRSAQYGLPPGANGGPGGMPRTRPQAPQMGLAGDYGEANASMGYGFTPSTSSSAEIVRLPLTPLGLSRTPPALPDLPPFLLAELQIPLAGFSSPAPAPAKPQPTSAPAPAAPAPEKAAPPPARHSAPPPPALNLAAPPVEQPHKEKESWTPVAEQEEAKDRRTFFYNEGKEHTYYAERMRGKGPRRAAEDDVELGTLMELKVEDVHFANPRIKVISDQPASMPSMLKWPHEKFSEYTLDVAQVSFGSYKVWAVIGILSNRLAYAMKRLQVPTCKVRVVESPPPPDEEDIDLTYGTLIQGIQLVP
eukprot:TRINITY_DN94006_c0_g1_i1.p1 TRINITY_DN94006_c0_g1~~TRINITY_DN94006_c0_g1_i1.p1  ORF type:complete len:339 (-),score=51.21 TRINITY_DN94006_c0_g1_i1:83-1099(-)